MVNSSFAELSSITPFLPESSKIWLEYLSVPKCQARFQHAIVTQTCTGKTYVNEQHTAVPDMPFLSRQLQVKSTSMNSLWLPQGSLLICETENNTYSLRLVAQHDPAGKLHIWETSHLFFSSATSGGVFLVSKASRSLSKVLSGHAAHIIGFSINYNKQRLLCLSPSPLPPPRPSPQPPTPALVSTSQVAVTHQKTQD